MVWEAEIVVELPRDGSFGVAGFDAHQLLPAQAIPSITFRGAGLFQILDLEGKWEATGHLVAAHLVDGRFRRGDHRPRIFDRQIPGCVGRHI